MLAVHSDGDVKSYYLRLCYTQFLKLYSSFASKHRRVENKILLHLTEIMTEIVRDKRNKEVQKTCRQLKIVQFLGKEIDLEFDFEFLKRSRDIEASESDEEKVEEGEVPKLNFGGILQQD